MDLAFYLENPLSATRKIVQTWPIENYQIQSERGWEKVVALHKTIPYEVWEVQTNDGNKLLCAGDHIVFDDKFDETFVKDLSKGDRILTMDRIATVEVCKKLPIEEEMYDFELEDGSAERYFTNDILSHNTYLAKTIADLIFNGEDNMVRIDMSEYSEKIAVSKLNGAAPGYVGYEEGGQLTEAVRRNPYSVVLFDEIEKAHPDIFNSLLQVLDDGRLTDSHGRKVDFSNCIIIMTTNQGVKELMDFGTGVGFAKANLGNDQYEQLKEHIEGSLKKSFKPEFLNRIDEIIVFNKLNSENIEEIFSIKLNELELRIEEAVSKKIKITEALKSKILEQGFDEDYGARPLDRAIQKYIETPLSNYILNNENTNSELTIDYQNEKVEIS